MRFVFHFNHLLAAALLHGSVHGMAGAWMEGWQATDVQRTNHCSRKPRLGKIDCVNDGGDKGLEREKNEMNRRQSERTRENKAMRWYSERPKEARKCSISRQEDNKK